MANFVEFPILSQRFSDAVTFALDKHSRQIRKDGSPYVAHLLSVSALVLENGGSEDDAIAAVLHDAVEDVGVQISEIKSLFGDNVARIVWAVTEHNKADNWKARKLDYISQIREGDDSVVLVSLADKTHNATAYLRGARMMSEDDSQSNPDRTLWFLKELHKVYVERLGKRYLVQVLERCLEELTIIWRDGVTDMVLITDRDMIHYYGNPMPCIRWSKGVPDKGC